jgi:membrane protein DedA with SNARE-associated domain
MERRAATYNSPATRGEKERGDMETMRRALPKVAIWAVVLGLLATLLADFGEWDRFLTNLLWRILIVTIGGLVGLIINYFAGNYVAMGTNVIESTGMVKFSEDKFQKIENGFIFICALTAAILAAIFIL